MRFKTLLLFILVSFALPAVQAPGLTLFGDGGKGSGSVLVSTDRQSQITLPKGWKEYRELNDAAEIQVANLAQSMYIIVLSESKEDFDKMTLVQHSTLTRKTLVKSITSSQVKGPERLTIGGNPGVQFEISGQFDNTKVVYLHTTVETPTHFHQILAWTLKSGFEKHRPEMQQVINSFREVR